ncbi:17-beta-hydroxysteroid dehydrogenase 13 [Drosophila grimshawi]|uniref:Short-chain dehydrogenase/reductase 3 n=1 Tax=Drosophila grimshawi TaxID=7222 RepID=B4JMD1_DROGR|nr:17-beta-hydroxysteroid dehydrogenase 13 [Drosophila grimshawi]EDV91892.1 GH24349 [Drosophila grimshawi]
MSRTTVSNNSRDGSAGSGGQNNDIYNYVVLIVDIVVLVIKFWVSIVEEFVKLFVARAEANVSGQFVLITGAGHGMGKEMALQYASLGAKVICWDVNEQTNTQTVKEIKQAGGTAFGYVCNVVKREDVMELAAKVRKDHGFINILVNNAGIMPCHTLLEHTEQETRLMYDINVLGNLWMLQAFLPEMIERNEGSIVALSSCAGLFGLPNLVPYCGTKFAVRGYMSSLAEELRLKNPQTNIKLTTIYPYMIDTGLCKNPRFRFPSLLKLVASKDAAASIILAQRQGLEEASVPRHFLYVEKAGRIIPKKAMRLVNDFLDTYVDTDKK